MRAADITSSNDDADVNNIRAYRAGLRCAPLLLTRITTKFCIQIFLCAYAQIDDRHFDDAA